MAFSPSPFSPAVGCPVTAVVARLDLMVDASDEFNKTKFALKYRNRIQIFQVIKLKYNSNSIQFFT